MENIDIEFSFVKRENRIKKLLNHLKIESHVKIIGFKKSG